MYEVIVVGGGHAGCEAALATSRKAKTRCADERTAKKASAASPFRKAV